MSNLASDNRLETNTLPEDTDNSEGQARTTPKKPLLKRNSSYYTPYMEDRLRRKLKFHFMGPHEKYKARKKCPWKLLLQIFKVIFVTIQLVIFGYERSEFVDYVEKNNIALKHLFLKDWDNSYETMPYPPAIGTYAIYTVEELKEHINFALERFYKTSDLALGHMRIWKDNGTDKPMELCLTHYAKAYIYPNNTYEYDPKVTTDCFDILPAINTTNNESTVVYDIDAFLRQPDVNRTIDYKKLLEAQLKFVLVSFRLDIDKRSFSPECFRVDGIISFDDRNRDGQMLVSLDSTLEETRCKGRYKYEDSEKAERLLKTSYDVFVIIISVLSCLLCLRSLFRAQKLKRKTVEYFSKYKRLELSWADRMEFLNLWYVVIVINDLLTVIGSAIKIQLEHRNAKSSSENYDFCGLLLGTGSLLVWMGVIRYIGFFKTFNILTVVLKKAFPDMMRFLVTTLMLYFGFMFCGWVVLGPYHIKFRHLSTSSECLFSLVNGDDMFVTFSATVTNNTVVWYYSRIFLYLFISLFIYAVLNLFIAVILDTYETIKEYYVDGFPKSPLFEFVNACDDSPDSFLYRGEDRSCSCRHCASFLSMFLCCCKRSV
ncbi:hypothetical protein FSP39_023650 [Pinctada imbricata]|uniref:Polycystin cation channel PKD1/PKD2 domain-containing protein n=1 Tax=Pinctada imbricata TaxID=66713 RepID=A0AA88XX79_PINIB|nr:hypothetical protein FSP39_023650 [Pinctada imbricata]